MSNGTPPTTNTTRNASSEQVQNQSEFYQLLIKSNAEAEKSNELLKKRTDLLELTAKQLRSETELQNTNATLLLNSVNEMERRNNVVIANQERIKEINVEIGALYADLINMSEEDQALAAKKNIELKKEQVLLEKNQETERDLFKFAKISQKDQEKLNKLLKIQVLEGVNLQKVLEDQGYTEQQKRDALEEAKAINKDFLDLQTKVKSVSEKVAGHIGVAASFGDTFLGSAVDLGERFKQMGGALGEGGMSGFLGDIVGQSFNFKNILSSVVEFSAKAALDISNLSRDLGAATGYGDKFNKQITTMGAKGNMAGIGFAESASALKTLTTTLSSFNPEAAETNAHVGMTVARLSNLGVTADTSAGVMDVLQRSMGISAEAAADMTAEIATMGKEVGITTTKMMADFKAAQGRLAAFGREGTQVFKELAAQAKATGMEMSKLTEISKTYDTFDAAADSIGKMNAVLGTQLSTLEMLEATDSERIMMIQQQVKMSVGNFDSLDRYTKMYIAQSMGVSDVAEAQRLLNMSTAEYQKTMNGQQKSADIQKELATATEELVPMMQQLKLAGTQVLLVFKPMITFFGGVIGVISELIGGIAWVVQGIGDFIGLTGEDGEVVEKIFGAIFTGLMLWRVGVLAAMGPWGLLIAGVTAFFAILHKPGSLSLADGLLDKTIGKSISQLGADAAYAQRDISGLSSEMEGMYDTTHKGGGAIDMRAMANLDATSMAAGLDKVKSAMMELSTLKIDGFLAMSTDGAKSSIVMGSQGVIKSLSEGRLSIDVNMPEISLPPINVVVKVDDVELKKVIDARIEKRATGA
jgi:hypothetical protein